MFSSMRVLYLNEYKIFLIVAWLALGLPTFYTCGSVFKKNVYRDTARIIQFPGI